VLGRILALGLLAAGVAAYVASRRREAADRASENGGSRHQAEQLRRELERQ
jgi:3-hydroxyisobutyrate dehydrogenase-like beta-hydroxyacid dehydrogenase